MLNSLYYFAQAYGEGNYGEGIYSCTVEQQQSGQCTTAAGGSTGDTGNPLANTGLLAVAVVTIACFIIFVSLLVRIWRRPKARPDATPPIIQPTVSDQNPNA